jgi:hypothetical protein
MAGCGNGKNASHHRFDDAEHRFRSLLAQAVALCALGCPQTPNHLDRCPRWGSPLLLEPGRDLSAGDLLPAATTHPRASDPATRHAGPSNRYGCSARGDASRAMNTSRTYQRVCGRRVLHDHEQGHCRDNKIFHCFPPLAPLADIGHSTRRAVHAYAKNDLWVPRAAFVRKAERSVWWEDVPSPRAPPSYCWLRAVW